ncbi:HET-domain-containing protein [Coniochaeta ligniaria NRRL 30616]|uniref:HET-domain-containing protein n=1 Tax=Coniochaeta ligniaria NRRL 30616 TaxID=1408157 RepID=A0A1J7J4U5_9PEZI|nr:HET-domain-containing protein [Coniochaeta ligniaria NRRL 30616]
MFGSSSKDNSDNANANEAVWAGLDPVERLMLDKDYAKQLAQSSKVCGVCNDLDLVNYPLAVINKVDGVERREATIEHLNVGWAARNIKNCGFCAMIADAIKSFFPGFYWGSTMPRLSSITMIEGEPILLTVEDRTETGETDKFGVEIYREPHVLVPSLRYLGAVSGASSAPSSESWLPFIKSCLEECTTSHKGCRGTTEVKIPTRILDIDALRNGTEDHHADVHLIRTSPTQKTRYATLSHSWGPDGIDFKLTESRRAAFEERIPFADLPATHQDAIVLARKLGLRYLWIDSLCIIQDSEADCQRETAMMGDIYSNSYLTIAAVSSPSSKVPFLHGQEETYNAKPVRFYGPRLNRITRDFLGFSGLRKTSVARLVSHDTLYARRTLRSAAPAENSASWSAPQGISDNVQGPLSKRAWTLQERALASRVVHFTAEGTRFECPTHFKAEDGHVSAPGYIGLLRELEAGSSSDERVLLRTKLQRLWRLMLSDYTQRGITRRSDLLPALSGLAARMQELHGAEYLAGLWRDRLLEDLCWTTQDAKWNRAPRVRADETSVPSWSWVSIAHPSIYPIINERGQFVPHCELVRCTVNLTKSQWNKFGQVISGELVLRGPVRKAKLTYAGQSTRGAMNTVDFGAGSTTQLEEDARLISVEHEVAGVKEKTWRRAVEGEESKWDVAEVWCLKVGTWTMGQGLQVLGNLDLDFVMVLGKSSRVEGAFERLGFLEKVYGGKAFDDVGGMVARNDKMEELFRDLEREGVIEPRKRSAAELKSLKRLRAEPVYPEATVMDITIV